MIKNCITVLEVFKNVNFKYANNALLNYINIQKFENWVMSVFLNEILR